MATDPNTSKIVGLLVEVAKGDTVYRDIHLRRARQLFSTTFDEASYRAIGSTEKEIEDLTRERSTPSRAISGLDGTGWSACV